MLQHTSMLVMYGEEPRSSTTSLSTLCAAPIDSCQVQWHATLIISDTKVPVSSYCSSGCCS